MYNIIASKARRRESETESCDAMASKSTLPDPRHPARIGIGERSGFDYINSRRELYKPWGRKRDAVRFVTCPKVNSLRGLDNTH